MNASVIARGMKANDILDLAFDMGLERPKIATAGEWDGGRIHILTHGPLAYRRTLEIPAPAMKDHVERQLRSALDAVAASEPTQPIVEQILQQQSYKEVPIAPPAKPKAKRVSKGAAH
jgi:hypothetical protein